MRYLRILAPALAVFAVGGATQAFAAGGTNLGTGRSQTTTTASNGGTGLGAPKTPPSTKAHPTVVGTRARIIHGKAYAPTYAPMAVKKIIWAGNKIDRKPYAVGGGHGRWNDSAYDCSGTVSYVLHAAGLLRVSEDSSEFESWGKRGIGQWVTVYTNPAHAFIEVAGIRLDTSAEGDPHPAPGTGPRWRPLLRDTQGFQSRHPAGL